MGMQFINGQAVWVPDEPTAPVAPPPAIPGGIGAANGTLGPVLPSGGRMAPDPMQTPPIQAADLPPAQAPTPANAAPVTASQFMEGVQAAPTGPAPLPGLQGLRPLNPAEKAADDARLFAQRDAFARQKAAQQAAIDKARGGAVAVGAPGQPGGGLGRVIGYAPGTPAHFEQAGNYYRGTPEQKQAIMGVLGANTDRIQAQGELSAAELANMERINSAADIEALKARKANQQQAVLEQMDEVDRYEANQAVREAIGKHAQLAAPDPAKYWGGLGFAGTVGMLIADSMDRIGSGMKGEKPSNLIERGIERSLQQQQAAIDKAKGDITQAQGLYAQMRQSGMDKEHAFQAAKARRMEDAAGIIDSYQRQARLPQVKAQLANQAADLRERAGMSFLQLSESIAGQGKGRQVAAQGGAPIYAGGDLKQRKAMAEVLKAEAEAGIASRKATGEVVDLDKTQVDLQKEIAQRDATIKQLDRLIETAPETSDTYGSKLPVIGGWLTGRKAAEWQNEAGGVLAKRMKEVSGAAFSEKELEMQKRYLFGHTNERGTIQQSLQRMKEEAKAERAAIAANLSAGQVSGYQKRVGTESTRLKLQGK